MPSHTLIWKIMKDQVDIYNAEKHRLPCWNCRDRSTCFSEKKATKRAKYLRYTVKFENPCVESILAIHLLHLANLDCIFTLEVYDESEIPNLFNIAVSAYNCEDIEYKSTGCAMFICVVLRDPNYISSENYTAYHYLGYFFYEFLKDIDLAIKLYSKGIELTPEDPSIIENRGFCFLRKNDFKNALNDFDRAKEIDGGCHPDLANIIDDIKNGQRGLRGNSNCSYQLNKPPESLFNNALQEICEYVADPKAVHPPQPKGWTLVDDGP